MGANPVPVQMKITGHAESRDGGTMALPLFETSMHPPRNTSQEAGAYTGL